MKPVTNAVDDPLVPFDCRNTAPCIYVVAKAWARRMHPINWPFANPDPHRRQIPTATNTTEPRGPAPARPGRGKRVTEEVCVPVEQCDLVGDVAWRELLNHESDVVARAAKVCPMHRRVRRPRRRRLTCGTADKAALRVGRRGVPRPSVRRPSAEPHRTANGPGPSLALRRPPA